MSKFKKKNLVEIEKKEQDKLNKIVKSLNQASTQLLRKPFSAGMYSFMMFIIDYYSKLKKQLNIDYDSFIIVQVVVSHQVYLANKDNKKSLSFKELTKIWEQKTWNNEFTSSLEKRKKISPFVDIKKSNKLSFSSICLVTNLPKETTRRKINNLAKKNILEVSEKKGVILGYQYKKIFNNFVPRTLIDFGNLLIKYEKMGIIEDMKNFIKSK